MAEAASESPVQNRTTPLKQNPYRVSSKPLSFLTFSGWAEEGLEAKWAISPTRPAQSDHSEPNRPKLPIWVSVGYRFGYRSGQTPKMENFWPIPSPSPRTLEAPSVVEALCGRSGSSLCCAATETCPLATPRRLHQRWAFCHPTRLKASCPKTPRLSTTANMQLHRILCTWQSKPRRKTPIVLQEVQG